MKPVSPRARRLSIAGILGCLLALAGVQASAGGVPSTEPMRYSGQLTDAGAPVTGPREISISLWDHATSADTSNRICDTSPDSPTMVQDGDFSLALNDECAAGIHEHRDVWIEVLVEGESFGREKVGAVPYALQADSARASVPIGGIIDWYQASADTPIPDGFVLAEGGMVSDARSPLDGMEVPDLRGRVVVGAEFSTELGASQPAHSEVLRTSTNGAHDHRWARVSGGDWHSGDGQALGTWGDGHDDNGSGIYPLMVENQRARSFDTSDAGNHSHTVEVTAGLPPHVPLRKLMRIF